MKEPDDVVAVLRRAFNGGPMRRLPKKQADAEALMALSMTGLQADTLYDETEIDQHLSTWLNTIAAEGSLVDHVSLRRALVDFRFLRRASDGVVYRVVPERVSEVLSPAATRVDAKQIFIDVTAARKARSDAH